MSDPKRLIVGISGASAPIYGIRILEVLRNVPEVETHFVHTKSAQRTIELETSYSLKDLIRLADVYYEPDDVAASISSGSFKTMGMVVAPCSMSSMGAIASSVSKDLLTRAADVTLKEGRRLVLMIREAPLHLGHLRRMVELAEMGAVIAPPIPSFYHAPKTIDDIINHSIGRVLDQFNIDANIVKRWTGPSR